MGGKRVWVAFDVYGRFAPMAVIQGALISF